MLCKSLVRHCFIAINQRQLHRTHPRILITGGCGQLGIPLAKRLRELYGVENIVLSDIVRPSDALVQQGIYRYADVMDIKQVQELLVNNQIDWLIHLSALLSAVGEKNVPLAMKLNIEGTHHMLELARKYKCRIFIPSTIGAFGPDSPRNPTPDLCIQRPRTIYGVSKVHAELLGEYFFYRFGVDFRCLRFPGIISADTKPGGGTTDYAIEIFHEALKSGSYKCYLRGDTRLPMMWIDDCIQSIINIMEASNDQLKQRTYNVAALSFTPEELTTAIKKYKPNFKISYQVDDRQNIAESWPQVLDDRNAREHWNWTPKVDLDGLVQKMFDYLEREKNLQ
ncbi:unnamed protein product [Rotaria sordida]|uniref:L-threonine 3-dehydrogenase, mitochondrial n=1 Tax=Rotaria sordida TaxID=392033 RepID=A0A818NKJ6_9BILA|nr:unnamed protein product [Rotaria sordida]CAF3605279.1 unnamed protein product [Rotaria sordida]